MEEHLLANAFATALADCFTTSKADAFENLLEPLQKLLRLSPPIAATLAHPDLFSRTAQKLYNKKAVVRGNLLRIVRSICDASEEQGALIRRYGLYDAIEHLAEADPAILVRNMANDLIRSCDVQNMHDLRANLDGGVGGTRHNRPSRRTSSSAAAAAAAIATPPPPPPALYSSSSQPPTPSRGRTSRPSTAGIQTPSSGFLDSFEDDQMRPPPRRPSATSRPRTSHGSSGGKRLEEHSSPYPYQIASSRENSGSGVRLTPAGSIGSSSGGSNADGSSLLSVQSGAGGKGRALRPPTSNPGSRPGLVGSARRGEEAHANAPPTMLPRRGAAATAGAGESGGGGLPHPRRRRQTSGN